MFMNDKKATGGDKKRRCSNAFKGMKSSNRLMIELFTIPFRQRPVIQKLEGFEM